MNNVNDLGEPDAISDVQRAQEAEEQNKILTDMLKQKNLLVAELEMKNEALEKQMLHLERDICMKVVDITRRFTAFKEAIALVMKELTRD